MTGIRALPPTYYVMTDSLRASASPQERMIAGDFLTMIKAQNKPLLAPTSSSKSARKLSQQQTEGNSINQKNVEEILVQLLASRKTQLNSTGKVVRPTIENLVYSDLTDREDLEPICEEKSIHCQTLQHIIFGGYGHIFNMPVGCAVNIPAAPVIYTGYTFIWTPIDLIRRDFPMNASSPYHKQHKPRFRYNYLNGKGRTSVYGDDW